MKGGSILGLLATHRLIFDERHDVGGGVSSFAFLADRPLGARAGQHGVLGLSATAMKPFSLASAPGAGHAYRKETEQWAGTAAYSQHAEQFRAATTEAALAYPHATFFVAGASPFVASTAEPLRRSGVADRRIRQDKYLFYKPRTGEQQ